MRKSRGRGPTIAKDINRKLIYERIKQVRKTSRVELSKLLQLNKNTISTIVDELIASGYIREHGPEQLTGVGRRPIILEFNGNNKWVIGVNVTSNLMLHYAVTDLYANPLETYTVPLPDPSTIAVVAMLNQISEHLFAKYPIENCIGMGVGLPGILSKDRKKIVGSIHTNWKDVDLHSVFQEGIRVPVHFDRSVYLSTLGESWYGSAKELNNFVFCSFGNGVSSGIVAGGKVIHGEENASGEVGHFVLDPQGEQCECGNRGCLETIASLSSIMRRLRQDKAYENEQLTLGKVITILQSGVPKAEEELKRVGRAIGKALGFVINLLNPSMIVFDGPLMQVFELLLPHIKEEMAVNCLHYSSHKVVMLRSGLYPMAGCIGAAASVIQRWEESVDPLELVSR